MSKTTTKATIDANIKQNGTQAITGPILNTVLNAMVDDYGAQDDLTLLTSEVSAIGLQGEVVEETDLSITDDSNPRNVIAKFKDGHIKTKKFDSEDVQNLKESFYTDGDFAVCDNEGNVVVKVANGHIKTKNFDSSNGVASNDGVVMSFDGILLVRNNTSIANGVYVTTTGKYCSNKIGCKNARTIKINGVFDKVVLFRANSSYTETTSSTMNLGGEFVAFVIQSSVNNLAVDVSYDAKENIDLSEYPLYFRVVVNQTRLNIGEGTSASQLDSRVDGYPLAVCHFASNFPFSKKVVLLNGGYGKALHVDGWASTNNLDSWLGFISQMQTNGFNVVSVEGGREITTSDNYREGAGYVMPSLGNPLIFQAFQKAHGELVRMFGMSERVGFVGTSQGGILAYNYHHLKKGGVDCVVVLAGLTRLKEDGWDRQGEDVTRYFNEWYGISTYDANAVKGFDPYKNILSIGNEQMLLGFPPLKCIYGSADTTALSEPAQEYVDAIKNANGVAEMHLVTGGTHTTVAGATDSVVVNETILWLNRFM